MYCVIVAFERYTEMYFLVDPEKIIASIEEAIVEYGCGAAGKY